MVSITESTKMETVRIEDEKLLVPIQKKKI